MTARVLLCLALLSGVAVPAAAHEIRPAFLQIREIEPAQYDILWKTPTQGEMRLALNVILPTHCHSLGEVRTTAVEGAAIQRWRATCDSGLQGQPIAIENLQTSLTDVLLRFEPLEGSPATLRMNGATPAATIPAQQGTAAVAWAYFRLGIEHILFGFDHLLFVLCLLMLVRKLRPLLLAITAFTVAHSITLAATTFGLLQIPSAPVEACIALSIAFVAAEIIRARTGKPGIAQERPWLAAFGFGLLHGLGFAAALREIGLPEGSIPLALLFFNLGVEAGQIAFISVVLTGYTVLMKTPLRQTSVRAWRAPAFLAGVVACFWFIQRTMQILW